MSWDWDAEDIDLDQDDRRIWVPIVPKIWKKKQGTTLKLHC